MSGGARLMLVEDEPAVGALLARLLGRAGYAVDLCGTGGEALERWDGSHALAVVDLGLPDIAGEEVVNKLLAPPAGAPIVVSSGSPVSEAMFPDANGRIHVLQKPYAPRQLVELIQRLLPDRSPNP